MSNDRRPVQYWFRAKRYGWGWGLPATWQGWVVFLLWVAVLGLACWAGKRNLPLGIVLFTIMTAMLVIVCFAKGEPLRWRWGDED